mgnify:FL=1
MKNILAHIRFNLVSNYVIYIVYACISTSIYFFGALILYYPENYGLLSELFGLIFLSNIMIYPGIALFLILRKTSLHMTLVLGKSRFIPVIISILSIYFLTVIISLNLNALEGTYGSPELLDLIRVAIPSMLIAINIHMLSYYPIQQLSKEMVIKTTAVLLIVFILYIIATSISMKVFETDIYMAMNIEKGISLVFFNLAPLALFIIGYKKANV